MSHFGGRAQNEKVIRRWIYGFVAFVYSSSPVCVSISPSTPTHPVVDSAWCSFLHLPQRLQSRRASARRRVRHMGEHHGGKRNTALPSISRCSEQIPLSNPPVRPFVFPFESRQQRNATLRRLEVNSEKSFQSLVWWQLCEKNTQHGYKINITEWIKIQWANAKDIKMRVNLGLFVCVCSLWICVNVVNHNKC